VDDDEKNWRILEEESSGCSRDQDADSDLRSRFDDEDENKLRSHPAPIWTILAEQGLSRADKVEFIRVDVVGGRRRKWRRKGGGWPIR
jgi:hypothetical protein